MDTLTARVIKDSLDNEDDDPICEGKDFDGYNVELSFLVKNLGQGLAEIDVLRLYHDGIFKDHERIESFPDYPFFEEWSDDLLAVKIYPGSYTSPLYLYVASDGVDQSWCEPKDFKDVLGEHKVAIQVFYRNQKGISKVFFKEFNILVAYNEI